MIDLLLSQNDERMTSSTYIMSNSYFSCFHREGIPPKHIAIYPVLFNSYLYSNWPAKCRAISGSDGACYKVHEQLPRMYEHEFNEMASPPTLCITVIVDRYET